MKMLPVEMPPADDTVTVVAPAGTPHEKTIDASEPKHTMKVRHGWPLDQRIGQVIKTHPTSVEIFAPSGTQVLASATGQVMEIKDIGNPAGSWFSCTVTVQKAVTPI